MGANQDSEKWWEAPPPVCRALLPIDPIRGQQNVNDVWDAEVEPLEGPHAGQLQRCVFKLHKHPGKLPVEMACTLVGAVLGSDVPKPCLVKVDPADLPGLATADSTGGELLLFGCTFIEQDSFFEQLATLEDSTLNGAVWNSFCSDAPKAAKAAALDELITNYDRHPRNLRFDGTRWWLIDHDNSLLQTHGKDVRSMSPEFKAHKNQVAAQLLDRRRHDHDMPDAARLHASKQRQVLELAARVGTTWRNADPRVAAIWKHTADLIELMSRRLPMLQAMLGARIGATVPTDLTWTTQPPPHTPPPPNPA